MGTNTPENPLLAEYDDERRLSYTPHEFLDAHARFYANYIFFMNRLAKEDLKLSPQHTRDAKFALTHFADALEYPLHPSLAAEMRAIGEAARLDLQEALEMEQADLTMPGMQQTVFNLLGIEGLLLKVKFDLIREGGIEDLRRAMFA